MNLSTTASIVLKYLNNILSQWLYPPLMVKRLFFQSVIDKRQTGFRTDPCAEAFIPYSLKAGYYMIECRSVLSEVGGLSLHFGNAEFGAALPLSVGKISKRVIVLSESKSSIFLRLKYKKSCSDFTESPLIDYLRILPLRRSFAIKHMMRRTGYGRWEISERAEKSRLHFRVYLYIIYGRTFIQDQFVAYRCWQQDVEPERLGKQGVGVTHHVNDESFIWFRAPNYRSVENARQIMRQALLNNPDAVLVYTDEDCMFDGVRESPWFKPSWNPDLFLMRDYISSCYMCRRDWYEQHRSVFERLGERLALSRLLTALPASTVLHVPLILSHLIRGNAYANQVIAKTSGLPSRSEVLKTILPEGALIEPGLLSDTLRIHYPQTDPTPKISLLIPTRDSLEVLKPCVESILSKTTYPDFEIIILDNQSQQSATLAWFGKLAKDSRLRIIQYNHSFNFSAINNFGVRHAQGGIIGLINNDIEVISPNWLTEMVSHACRPEIGCVGAKLYYGDGRIQHAGIILSEQNIAMHGHRYFAGDADGDQGRLKLVQNYSAVTGACLVVRKEVYEQVGGLDEENLAVAYNDVDFCLKVREAGYRNLWTPYAELYHHESVSRGYDDTPEKRKRLKKEAAYMRKRWGKELANDPCYNPNLTQLKEDFSVRVF